MDGSSTAAASTSIGTRSAGSCARSVDAAGLGHVHPHQLRHTLATQAINRGMRLEAIATMLGHRSLRMTLTYARIANKTVADEYATASAKIDALYTSTDPENRLKQLASEHRRMLANGWCNRPIDTDCVYETICEGCGYYETTDRVPAHPPGASRSRQPQPPTRPSSDLHATPDGLDQRTPAEHRSPE